MAEATHSSIVLRDVEARIGELQAVAEQRHADVKGELMQIQSAMKGEITLLQNSMNNLSGQLMEIIYQNLNPNQNQPRGQYQALTRFTKMDLPKFTKDDVVKV